MAQNSYFFRIESRKNRINDSGVTRNRKYKEYLDSGFEYNQLKKAFYDVTHLAILDGDISEIDGERYVSTVKSIDRQLLDQLKRNEYFIEEDIRDMVQANGDPASIDCWYLAGVNDRMNRIMEKGEWRNKLYAEFQDASAKYMEYKTAYCKAVNVAVIERHISENDGISYNAILNEVDRKFDFEMRQLYKNRKLLTDLATVDFTKHNDTLNRSSSETVLRGGVGRNAVRGRKGGKIHKNTTSRKHGAGRQDDRSSSAADRNQRGQLRNVK